MVAFAPPPSPRYISPADTAKLVRAALKAAFPAEKFRVRTHVYAGGASIDVNWTDGPTAARVDREVQRFAGARFDGMDDSMTYREAELDGERVRFGAHFIFANRAVSAEFRRRVLTAIVERYGLTMPDVGEDGWPVNMHRPIGEGFTWTWDSIIYRAMGNRTVLDR